jgi:hypothetical protein
LKGVVIWVGNVSQRADVEGAHAVILESGQRRVLAKNVGGAAIREGIRKAEPARHLRDHPPVGLGFAGRRQKGALAGDAALRIGDGAVLLAPGGGRQQHMGAGRDGVVGEDVFRHDQQVEAAERLTHGAGARQRHGRIGRHHPQGLDIAALDGREHVDGLEPLGARHRGRAPEAADAIDVGLRKSHMGGELVGEPAHFASPHGVGLPRQRERPHAGPADAAGGEMAVDDGRDLVGALGRLVDALRERRDGAPGGGEQVEEVRDVARRKSRGRRRGGDVRRDGAGAPESFVEAGRVGVHIGAVDGAGVGEMDEEAAEQNRVHAGRDREHKIGVLGGRRAARIDDDDFGAAPASRRHHALVEYRMAPGGVGAHQHDQVGLVEIRIDTWHHVGPETAAMAGDGRRHAQARIGIHIGGAQKALHELVGDVVVLGEELAGEIEGDGVRPMAIDHPAKAGGDAIEGIVPGGARERAVGAAQHRMEKPAVEGKRFAQRCALGAQPPGIGGMFGIADDRGAAAPIRRRHDAAADAAIRAGGAD